MKQRRLLALPAALVLAAAAVTAVAGCSGGSSSNTAAASTGTNTPDVPVTTATPTETDASTPTPTDSPSPTDAQTDTPSPTDDAPTDTYTPDPPPTTDVPAPQSGPSAGTYSVTISGSVGGTDFERTGTLQIRDTIAEEGTTNGVNPVDVCLVSGFPAGQPDVGAIWLGSNSGCDPGASAADIDLGYVTLDGSTVTFEPDERVAATFGNNFTESSGLAACPYTPVSGQLSITIDSDGSVSGSVDTTGYGGASCGSVRYQADISG
jgi:hypothetical protein